MSRSVAGTLSLPNPYSSSEYKMSSLISTEDFGVPKDVVMNRILLAQESHWRKPKPEKSYTVTTEGSYTCLDIMLR